VSGLSNAGFYAACAVGVVLWLLPALILSTTYAVCNRSAEQAYRDGHRDGWAAADYQRGERAAAGFAHELAVIEPDPPVQTDAALIGVAATLVDLAEQLRRERP
jgi:hypothetical protein